MREVLFRGQRVDNGEWITGYYFQKPNIYTEDGQPIEHFIADLPPFCAKVIPETISQYTGLKDKNGVRIFEGDILSVTGLSPNINWDYTSVTGVVEFTNGAFEVVGVENDDYTPYAWLHDSFPRFREVIGNIHDNPELLGVGESLTLK